MKNQREWGREKGRKGREGEKNQAKGEFSLSVIYSILFANGIILIFYCSHVSIGHDL